MDKRSTQPLRGEAQRVCAPMHFKAKRLSSVGRTAAPLV